MEIDASFAGTIPSKYDRYLGPLLFEPYAKDLAKRISEMKPRSVLEVACGTGIVTRKLRASLPRSTSITATDLSDSMIATARQLVAVQGIEWRQADAQDLPFSSQSVDVVVSQFGMMFFPEKELAAREAFRVLKPGGAFLFNVWNPLSENPLVGMAHRAVRNYIEGDVPAFFDIPFSYHDPDTIERMLNNAGFNQCSIQNLKLSGSSPRASDAAIGLLEGNPIVLQINELAPGKLPEIRESLTKSIKAECGEPVKSALSALVVKAIRPR